MEKIKKRLTKKAKAAIAILVAAAVIAAGCGLFAFFTSSNSYALYNKVLLSLMPESIEHNGLTFYVKPNPDYNAKESPESDQFIYYFMAKEKEIDLPGGVYTDVDKNKTLISAGFYVKAMEQLNKIKSAVHIVIGVMAFIVVAVLIYIWYKLWCRREEKEKALLYGNKPKKKK